MTRPRAALGLAIAVGISPAGAQEALPPPLAFSQGPPLVAGRLPAPHVFLAVHGSAKRRRQLPALQASLRANFGVGRLASGRIRLAWQTTSQCEEFPDRGALCRGRNGLALLDDARRPDLEAFADGLRQDEGDGAIALELVRKAEAHLTATAGSSQGTLGCRQAHILLVAAQSHAPPIGERSSLALHNATVDGADLATALGTILAESTSLPTQVVSSLAAGAQTLFAARFNAERWSGEVVARPMAPGSEAPNSSASLLDARDPDTRVIFSSQGSGVSLRGIAWRWDQLAPAQRAALDAGDGQGPQRLRYLRGERTGEISQGGRFRNRASRQADSVNSRLWLAPGRQTMLYLGSNGGMLHGFDAATGHEQFAYVPQGVYPRLVQLTQPQYTHQPYVDGSAFAAELPGEGDEPRTWLAGFLGAGGKGYFVLDVSDPDTMAEDRAAQWVRLDTTASADPDLGHVFSEPVRERADSARSRQITRLNDGRLALVTGNGYNSAAQRAVLLIQYLDGAHEVLKIPVGQAGGNGLSAPRLVDLDGDQVPDLAYAGDLRGQLWRFELGAREAGQWHAAFGGRPLFIAQDAAGKRQPITAAPLWMQHPEGGRMVVVGTGRLLVDADRNDTHTQSVYGIHDRDEANPLPAGRGALVQQSIDRAPAGSVAGQQLWRSSAHAVPTRGSEAKGGWFLDLPLPGERVVANPGWFEGKLIDLTSIVPPSAASDASESCDPPTSRSFRTTLNAIDGARPRSQLYGDAASSLNASRIELRGEPGVPLKSRGTELTVRFASEDGAPRHRLGFIARRPSWRQLQ